MNWYLRIFKRIPHSVRRWPYTTVISIVLVAYSCNMLRTFIERGWQVHQPEAYMPKQIVALWCAAIFVGGAATLISMAARSIWLRCFGLIWSTAGLALYAYACYAHGSILLGILLTGLAVGSAVHASEQARLIQECLVDDNA